jgi:WD40 repeat protein
VLVTEWMSPVRLYDVESGAELMQLVVPPVPVRAAAFSPDGTKALTAGGGLEVKDGRQTIVNEPSLCLWDLATGEELLRVRQCPLWIWSVAFSPDGRHALTGSGAYLRRPDGSEVPSDCLAQIWDLETGEEVQRFQGHQGQVNCAAYVPGSRRILTGSSDETVRLWNADTGDELHCFTGHTDQIYSISCSADGRLALSGSYDATLRLWRLPEADGR